ncbi:hypothetical protein PMG11_09858 [Penicillium brasilianum]|uniref:Uncharacterized protein n=1 Tax=Penicillium brasilianum TaxID=104259 RepID=A0A0F7TXB3_PENBI|nr:hypothetical protein PMG11_09858 [Penicillium brasilianum]
MSVFTDFILRELTPAIGTLETFDTIRKFPKLSRLRRFLGFSINHTAPGSARVYMDQQLSGTRSIFTAVFRRSVIPLQAQSLGVQNYHPVKLRKNSLIDM